MKSLLNQAVIRADPPAGKRSDPPDEKQHIIPTVPPEINVLLRAQRIQQRDGHFWRDTPAAFDAALQELIQLVKPQKTNTYTVPRLANQVFRFSWFPISCRTKRLPCLFLQEVSDKHGVKEDGTPVTLESEFRNGHAPLTRNRFKTSICTFGVGSGTRSSPVILARLLSNGTTSMALFDGGRRGSAPTPFRPCRSFRWPRSPTLHDTSGAKGDHCEVCTSMP